MTSVPAAPARRRLRPRAYLPIAILAAIQGLYIAAAPSASVRQSELGQVSTIGPQTGANGFVPGAPGVSTPTGGFGSGSSPGVVPQTPGTPGTPSSPGSPAPSTPTPGANPADPGTPGVSTPDQAATADFSHCSPNGRQHDKFFYEFEAPVCFPKWPAGQDNGGATYQGVTGDTIDVVIFEEQPNDQIDAILAAQDLAMNEDDRVKLQQYGMAFINKYYETYGRKVNFIRFKSKCPITPPDVTTCKSEARKVVDMKPFMVIFSQSVYPELFDEWARAGIIAMGGWNWADSYFTARRPFRYDTFITGTIAARHVAEYYCKKMAGNGASNAGNVIHPTIGGRDTQRKVGIISNEITPLSESARFLAGEIQKCEGGAYNPEVVTYVGDIDRAAEIQEAVSSKMINSGTTTVICWCGPLEMTGFSKNFTSQQYYPEHLLGGIGFMDGDVFGRLYDPAQWVHAFGPSHVADPRPKEEQQMWAAYVEAGDPGGYTTGALLQWQYMDLIGQVVQYAGPNLNPLTLESGLFQSPGTGGEHPRSLFWSFGPGDYGGQDDVREVWYDPSMESDFDGARGGYQVLNDHKRFRLGEWPGGFEVPPAPN